MTRTRNPKGTVGVEKFRGMLRLRLPRSIFADGSQCRISLGLPNTPANQEIAQAKANLIQAKIDLGIFDPNKLDEYKPTKHEPPQKELPDLVQLWQQYTKAKSKTLAHSNINRDFKRVASQLARMPKLSTAKSVRNYLVSNLSADGARRILNHLRACCKWAKDEGLIDSNPFTSLTMDRTRRSKTISPFTRSERDLIIEAFSQNRFYSYYTPFVKFLFWTGCRTSEAIALKWQHIDPGLTYITFAEAIVDKVRKDTKTHKVRKFPINQAVRELLQAIAPEYPSPDALVFPSPKGLSIDPHNFLNRAWKGILKTLPIPYRSQYHTRHTFITLCLENGVQVAQIAAWVGNSPSVIYSNYAGLVSTVQVPEP